MGGLVMNIDGEETAYAHLAVLKPNDISHLKGLLKFRLLGSIHRVSHVVVGLGLDTCICLSHKSPGDAVPAYLGNTLGDLNGFFSTVKRETLIFTYGFLCCAKLLGFIRSHLFIFIFQFLLL